MEHKGCHSAAGVINGSICGEVAGWAAVEHALFDGSAPAD